MKLWLWFTLCLIPMTGLSTQVRIIVKNGFGDDSELIVSSPIQPKKIQFSKNVIYQYQVPQPELIRIAIFSKHRSTLRFMATWIYADDRPQTVTFDLANRSIEIEGSKISKEISALFDNNGYPIPSLVKSRKYKNEFVETVRKFLYLHLQPNDSPEIAELAANLIELIPANSPLFRWHESIVEKFMTIPKGKIYIESVLFAQKDPEIVSQILFYQLRYFHDANDSERARNIFRRLASEHKNSNGYRLSLPYNPDGKVKSGQPIVDFSLNGLNGKINNEVFKNKTYLIMFWTTWCAPCIRKFPLFHKLYHTLRTQNFDILAIAFDNLENFQKMKDKWPMPWHHVLVPDESPELQQSIRELFEAPAFFPYYILVGSDGRIVSPNLDGHEEKKLENQIRESLKTIQRP